MESKHYDTIWATISFKSAWHCYKVGLFQKMNIQLIVRCFAVAFGLLVCQVSWGQTEIRGTVADKNAALIPDANVFLKGSYDGCASSQVGAFQFTTSLTGKQILVASAVGFQTIEVPVTVLGKVVRVDVIVGEVVQELGSVTVTAGSFEASDEKKSVMLKALDIVTVAGSMGDVMGALATLPGAQRAGNDGFLVVRGGDATESKTFIDGVCVEKQYSSRMPDLPARGRFSPMLFKGTMFSTGGFSAQYGQALSSVLDLETVGLAERSQVSASIMSLGLGASAVYQGDSSSVSIELNYNNLQAYYALLGKGNVWTKAPSSLGGVSTYRKQTKHGMLRSMIQVNRSGSGMLYENLDSQRTDSLSLRNTNVYLNTSYQCALGETASLQVSSGFMYDSETIDMSVFKLDTHILSGTAGVAVKHFLGANALKYGLQLSQKKYSQTYQNPSENLDVVMPFSQFIASFFAEYEWKLTHKLLLKPGLRYEYAAQNMEQNVQARIAIAYKTSRYTQVSFAGGSFRQLQADDYVKFNATLKSAQAAQYIVNFQFEKNGRLFRMESYYKQYRSLISYEYLNSPKPESYTTDGKGFARGIDLFYRDTESIKNGDFWVSYAYVDAKRRYKDYPVSTQADYLSPHTFALVYKQYFNIVHTQFGFSYNYSSGKKYNNPNESQFMSGRLAGIHDLSFSFSYLTTIFGQQAILHGSVSNLLGFDYLYGYRFASRANDDGIFRSRPIEPMAKRMLFCGLFINM